MKSRHCAHANCDLHTAGEIATINRLQRRQNLCHSVTVRRREQTCLELVESGCEIEGKSLVGGATALLYGTLFYVHTILSMNRATLYGQFFMLNINVWHIYFYVLDTHKCSRRCSACFGYCFIYVSMIFMFLSRFINFSLF